MSQVLVFVGTVVHSTGRQLEIKDDALLLVRDGKVAMLESSEQLEDVTEKYGVEKKNIVILTKEEFLMPGLLDTHMHAPQYPNIGLGYDKTLLEWLEAYTFPIEATYSDTAFAKRVYDAVVRKTLSAGTTTACYFATVHEESSVLLAEVTARLGQRALVGKVNMNMNHPANYGETTAESLASTERFINAVRNIGSELVLPVITPRFAITCDSELMENLGKLAKKYDVHIQTHISENAGEIAAVKSLFPVSKNYADVYDLAELLTNKTILAHAVHLEDSEVALLANRGTAVAHCANSNVCLQSGLCDVRRLLDAGVKVGLGTDFSGGSGFSVMDAMRNTLNVSNCIMFGREPDSYKPLNYEDAMYLATLGGAQALALDSVVGNFEVGKDFDGLVINMNSGPSELLKDYTSSELVQKFVYLADDRNIKQVYVKGKLVHSLS